MIYQLRVGMEKTQSTRLDRRKRGGQAEKERPHQPFCKPFSRLPGNLSSSAAAPAPVHSASAQDGYARSLRLLESLLRLLFRYGNLPGAQRPSMMVDDGQSS